MDDLALLKDMADTTPLPHGADLAPARARLMDAISQTAPSVAQAPAAVNPTSTTVRKLAAPAKRRRRSRFLVSGAAVIGLAAAITGVVSLGALEPVGVAPAKASAAEILHQAADAARAQPGTPPRPDQFIYTKSQLDDGSIREVWFSVDGTRDSIVRQFGETFPIPGCVGGQRPVLGKDNKPMPGQVEQCEANPAYKADLPTDAAAMRQYLLALPTGEDKTNSLGKNIGSLVSEDYVSPASLAALFEAVAGLDGLEVVENAKDGAGRTGIGVSWDHQGSTATLVFDEKTHAFLGFNFSAQLAQAVVDTAGQQP
jgi:hypothetical protein